MDVVRWEIGIGGVGGIKNGMDGRLEVYSVLKYSMKEASTFPVSACFQLFITTVVQR